MRRWQSTCDCGECPQCAFAMKLQDNELVAIPKSDFESSHLQVPCRDHDKFYWDLMGRVDYWAAESELTNYDIVAVLSQALWDFQYLRQKQHEERSDVE